jgi:hypothetical protein
MFQKSLENVFKIHYSNFLFDSIRSSLYSLLNSVDSSEYLGNGLLFIFDFNDWNYNLFSFLIATTASPIVISIYWTFDYTTADSYGIYNGTLMNGAGYVPYTNTLVYDGNSSALSLTAASNQSVLVSNPFLNLTYTSFTVEAWIYPTLLTSDRGIFGQCQCSTCANKCFYFNVREGYLYADFIDNYVSGSTALSTNT